MEFARGNDNPDSLITLKFASEERSNLSLRDEYRDTWRRSSTTSSLDDAGSGVTSYTLPSACASAVLSCSSQLDLQIGPGSLGAATSITTGEPQWNATPASRARPLISICTPTSRCCLADPNKIPFHCITPPVAKAGSISICVETQAIALTGSQATHARTSCCAAAADDLTSEAGGGGAIIATEVLYGSLSLASISLLAAAGLQRGTCGDGSGGGRGRVGGSSTEAAAVLPSPPPPLESSNILSGASAGTSSGPIAASYGFGAGAAAEVGAGTRPSRSSHCKIKPFIELLPPPPPPPLPPHIPRPSAYRSSRSFPPPSFPVGTKPALPQPCQGGVGTCGQAERAGQLHFVGARMECSGGGADGSGFGGSGGRRGEIHPHPHHCHQHGWAASNKSQLNFMAGAAAASVSGGGGGGSGGGSRRQRSATSIPSCRYQHSSSRRCSVLAVAELSTYSSVPGNAAGTAGRADGGCSSAPKQNHGSRPQQHQQHQQCALTSVAASKAAAAVTTGAAIAAAAAAATAAAGAASPASLPDAAAADGTEPQPVAAATAPPEMQSTGQSAAAAGPPPTASPPVPMLALGRSSYGTTAASPPGGSCAAAGSSLPSTPNPQPHTQKAQLFSEPQPLRLISCTLRASEVKRAPGARRGRVLTPEELSRRLLAEASGGGATKLLLTRAAGGTADLPPPVSKSPRGAFPPIAEDETGAQEGSSDEGGGGGRAAGVDTRPDGRSPAGCGCVMM